MSGTVVFLLLTQLYAAYAGERWNTEYYTTFNYTTPQPEPIVADAAAKQVFSALVDEGFLTTQMQDLRRVLRRRKVRKLGDNTPQQQQQRPVRNKLLIAATTTNVWDRTEGMLLTLAAAPEPFDLLIIDECSTDGTREHLQRMNVNSVLVNETKGVTYHWNVAYQYFLQHDYTYLIITNNDVLVPRGALSSLVRSMEEGCDLVSPLSTVNGKGHYGLMEGLESVYNLTAQQARQVEGPLAYAKIQTALDQIYSTFPLEHKVERGNEVDFNGFFFGVHRRIDAAAYQPGKLLFSDQLISFNQERDLSERMREKGLKKCVDMSSFVFHYKGATIPQERLQVREKFRASCEEFQQQQAAAEASTATAEQQLGTPQRR